MLRTLDSTYLLLWASAEPLQASKYKCPFNSVLRGQDRPATQVPVPRHTGGTPPLPNLPPTAGETLLFQEECLQVQLEWLKSLPKGKYKGAHRPEKVASPRRTGRF